MPVLYADFNNADSEGRLRLNCQGTLEDLTKHGIKLKNGMMFTFSDGELTAEGTVSYSEDERIWVASIDWGQVKP